jgi:hypothetical protein
MVSLSAELLFYLLNCCSIWRQLLFAVYTWRLHLVLVWIHWIFSAAVSAITLFSTVYCTDAMRLDPNAYNPMQLDSLSLQLKKNVFCPFTTRPLSRGLHHTPLPRRKTSTTCDAPERIRLPEQPDLGIRLLHSTLLSFPFLLPLSSSLVPSLLSTLPPLYLSPPSPSLIRFPYLCPPVSPRYTLGLTNADSSWPSRPGGKHIYIHVPKQVTSLTKCLCFHPPVSSHC